MIRAALLVLFAVPACKDKPAKQEPSPKPVAAPVDRGATIEPAAAKLPGELWFIDDGSPRRVLALSHGKARVVGKGSDEVFGALYPTPHRLPDGRTLAIASHGDGRPDGETLVLVGERGSITTIGPRAMQVRDPTLSPDGTWIVAAVQTEGITNLVLIELASGASKPLTTNREGNFAPIAISKDAIAFVSSRDGDSEIYRMNVDGTGVQRLTAFHRDDFEPAIDASGTQLAFTSDREQKVPRIFAVVPDGTGLRRMTAQADPAVEEGLVVWSPSSRAFAYTQKRDGREQIALVGATEKVLTPPEASDSEVAFSPDGKWLVLVRTRAGAAPPSGEHDHASPDAELVAYPLPAGPPIAVARGAIRTPRWF